MSEKAGSAGDGVTESPFDCSKGTWLWSSSDDTFEGEARRDQAGCFGSLIPNIGFFGWHGTAGILACQSISEKVTNGMFLGFSRI